MLVRSAYWIGEPKPRQATRLRAMLDEELIPAMRRFPGVAGVRVLWPQAFEDGPPAIFCQVMVEFDGEQDRHAMMTSEARKMLRSKVLEAVTLFDGYVSHIDFVVA